MIPQINILIDVNLKLFYKSEDNSLKLKDFKDDSGKKFQYVKTFAGIMEKKKLITPKLNEESCYILTKIGKQVYENGGWLKHLKNKKKVKNKTAKFKKKYIVISLLLITFIFIIILILNS